MSEKKETNYIPWMLGAVVLFQSYLMWNQQAAKPNKPDEPKPVIVSPSKTLDSCYLADRSSKLEILKGIAATKDATDEQKLKQFNTESESKRVKDFQPYVDLVGDALASEKLDELISKLQAKK
jgi:hypothetical protein